MKAKEYVKNYLESFENKCFDELPIDTINKMSGFLGVDIYNEFHETCKSRNIGKGSSEISLVNVIREYNQKWRNIAYKINEYFIKRFDCEILNYAGFVKLFEKVQPDLKYIIEKYDIN